MKNVFGNILKFFYEKFWMPVLGRILMFFARYFIEGRNSKEKSTFRFDNDK